MPFNEFPLILKLVPPKSGLEPDVLVFQQNHVIFVLCGGIAVVRVDRKAIRCKPSPLQFLMEFEVSPVLTGMSLEMPCTES